MTSHCVPSRSVALAKAHAARGDEVPAGFASSEGGSEVSTFRWSHMGFDALDEMIDHTLCHCPFVGEFMAKVPEPKEKYGLTMEQERELLMEAGVRMPPKRSGGR